MNIKKFFSTRKSTSKESSKITTFHSSYINISKVAKYPIKHVAFALNNEVFILPEVAGYAKDLLESRIANYLSSKKLKYDELKVFLRSLILKNNHFELEAFIIVTNPTFKIGYFPTIKLAVVPYKRTIATSMYRPYKWNEGLYVGNTMTYDEVSSLLSNLESIKGFHFNGAKYTEDQFKELASTLKEYKVLNPILHKKMK